MAPDEEEFKWLQDVQQGNEEALLALMQRHKQALFQFVYRYLGNDADASEVTESTFFKVYQKAHTFSPKASVKTWIFSIALNLSRDLLRRRKKYQHHVSFEGSQFLREHSESIPLNETLDSGIVDPARHLSSTDHLSQIASIIQRLPEKLRFPFVFCVLEDHTHDECAEILKTSRKTVETRIYRARKRLVHLLGERTD